eukprot:Colp12_sorted_trinity150504_noHs@22919
MAEEWVDVCDNHDVRSMSSQDEEELDAYWSPDGMACLEESLTEDLNNHNCDSMPVSPRSCFDCLANQNRLEQLQTSYEESNRTIKELQDALARSKRHEHELCQRITMLLAAQRNQQRYGTLIL